MLDKDKAKIQNEAFNAWNQKRVGTVEMATGMGKTFVALLALNSMDPDAQQEHLFLAETNEREIDLRREIKKYDEIYGTHLELQYRLQFACYQTAYKWSNKEFGLVIADEIHDGLTPQYSLFFENNSYEALIGLSAKVDVTTKYPIVSDICIIEQVITKGDYLNKYAPIVYSYDMAKAVKNNLKRKLDIHIIDNHLKRLSKTVRAGTKKNTFMTSEYHQYKYYEDALQKIETEEDYRKKIGIKKVITAKMARLLYNLSSKEEAAKILLSKLHRTIVFGNSIDSLLRITPYVITSRNSDDENNHIRKQFERENIPNIASFKKLKQGANITNIDNCIIVSYYSKELDAIQRFGRLRKRDDIKGNVFIFVTKGTREEKWYQSMLVNIKESYEVFHHVDVNACLKFLGKQESN